MTDETQTPTPPISVTSRWKPRALPNGSLLTPTEREWAIENHRTLRTGHVDWKSTAHELAQQVGDLLEKRAVSSREHYNAIQAQRDAESELCRMRLNVLGPLQAHWTRHFLPASIRAQL